MSEQSYLLNLEGMAAPSGEIAFRDLADLADALQLTATRIGRQVGRVEGPGRTPNGIDDASALRLRNLRAGSTGIDFVLGNTNSLPGMPDEAQVKERFAEIVAGVAYNDPPKWVSPLVAKAAERVAFSIVASGAKRFTFSSDGRMITRAPVSVATIDCSVWKVDSDVVTAVVSVTGLLEAVDLRANRFRIRDDIGNDIRLEDLADVERAAALIGHRVVATGMSERDDRNRMRLVEPVVVAEQLPANWVALPEDADGPGVQIPDSAVAGLTGEEISAFLAEIRA